MNTSPWTVLLAEGGASGTSVGLRTFTTTARRCNQTCMVSTSTSLLEALQNHRRDVALLQMLVLQPDPAAAVRHLHELAPEVALIIWAEPADEEIAEKCIQAGAKDYMLEGFMDERTLARVLRTATAAKAGVHALNDVQESSANAASRSVHSVDGHPVEQPGLAGSTVRMCVEVQNFKKFRERNGRITAEELMQRIAHVLRKSVRASDSVSSNHAGQFIVALQDSEASSLSAVRRRIAVRLLALQQSRGLRSTVSFCIDDEVVPGIVHARPGEYREAAASAE